MKPDVENVSVLKNNMYVVNKTPRLFKNFFHLGTELDSQNRWLKLSDIVPWEEIEEIYGHYFSQETGRPAKDARLICGLFIVKYIKNISDEEAIREFYENPYIQAFCGREYFSIDNILNSALLSERRKRLGKDFFTFFENRIIPIINSQKFIRIRTQSNNMSFFHNIFDKIKSLFYK